MNNPLASDSSRSFGLLAARVSLGLMLAIAGIEKLARGTSNFVDYTSTRAPSFMPAWYARHVPAALPYAAVVVGCLLAFGFLTRFAGLFAAVMFVTFAVAYTGLRDPSRAYPFHPILAFLGIALLVLFAGPGKISLDGWIWGRRGAA